jgi:hypothetical protein
MPNQPHDQPEQELSIKERSHELFLKLGPPEGSIASKSFGVHLRETAAQPLSTVTTSILWIAGVIVAVLFLATVFRIIQRHNGPPRSAAKTAVSTSSISPDTMPTIAAITDAGLSPGELRWQDKKFGTSSLQ